MQRAGLQAEEKISTRDTVGLELASLNRSDLLVLDLVPWVQIWGNLYTYHQM